MTRRRWVNRGES